MTNVLAIASDPDLDALLMDEVAATHPDHVTVLLLASGFAADRWADGEGPRASALRTRLAELLAHAQDATGAPVAGVVGDLDAAGDGVYDEIVRAPVAMPALAA